MVVGVLGKWGEEEEGEGETHLEVWSQKGWRGRGGERRQNER